MKPSYLRSTIWCFDSCMCYIMFQSGKYILSFLYDKSILFFFLLPIWLKGKSIYIASPLSIATPLCNRCLRLLPPDYILIPIRQFFLRLLSPYFPEPLLATFGQLSDNGQVLLMSSGYWVCVSAGRMHGDPCLTFTLNLHR